jgi:hypothetical protein
MAAYQDLYLDIGTDFTEEITLSDSYGNPYNLTYFTVNAMARTSYITSNVALQFVSTVSDAANGIITISANNAVTSNVCPNNVGKLVYDVLITDNTGRNTRVVEGQIYVSPSVTR